MAKIAWAFKITSSGPVDASMETGFTTGFVLGPTRYPAKFVARSAKHILIVEDEALKAEGLMERFD
jgi:hypothetical protein